MDQGIGTIGNLAVLGIHFPYCRGVSPSVAQARIVPLNTFDRFVGNLVLSYGGQTQTFTDMAVVSVAQENFEVGRDAWRWNICLQDRRWKWRYPRISGRYNRRLCDGSIDPQGKKNARELATLLVTELGDSIDVDEFPTNVWPPIVWENAFARFELSWLCDLFGLIVCPQSGNTFTVEPLTSSSTTTPAGAISPATYSNKPSIIPSSLRVQGEQRTQDWIPLRAIGLDDDGKYRDVNDLNIKPGTGWGDQWWHIFPDVEEKDRHLAVQTVYQLYSPVDPTIIISDYVLEPGLDATSGIGRCLPAQIRGAFFSHDDFGTTTAPTTLFTGEWRFRKDLNAIELAYPAFKITGGQVAAADLQINCSHYKVDADGNPIDSYTKDLAVSQAVRTTKPRVLVHRELRRSIVTAAIYGGQTGDNQGTVDSEAQPYLAAMAATYTYSAAKDVTANGLVLPFSLSSSDAQIVWQAGNGATATSRIGVNSEVDYRTAMHQQKRAQERLHQMAERLGV